MPVYQQGLGSRGFVLIWAAEVRTHFVEPEAEGGSFPTGFTGATVSSSHPASQPSSLLAKLELLQPTSSQQNQPDILGLVMSPHAAALTLPLATAQRDTVGGWAGPGWLSSIADAGSVGHFSS